MNYIFFGITFYIFFLMTIAMLYLKKVLFFEDQTPHVGKVVKVLLLIQACGSVLLVPVFGFLGAHPSPRNTLIHAGLFILYVVFVYATIAYTSFYSRKQRKWMAFFLPVPLFVFTLSIYNFGRLTGTVIKLVCPASFYNEILIFSFTILVILVCVLRNIRGSFVWRFEHFTEGKSLSFKEECVVFFIAMVLGLSIYMTNVLEAGSVLLRFVIMSYSFFLAIIGLYTVFNLNARKYYESQTQILQRTLINTMADLVENRDENTGGHIKRTAKYVEVIAQELQREKKFSNIINDDYISDCVIAAPLHDIGKIHVPDSILDKPGKLTDEEYEIMKTHTTAGYRIICHVEKQTSDIPYIQIAKQMARYHHEWLDGTGYPEGISGDDIPLCAKMLAVADVFDALVSKRCYKEPMPTEKAYGILHEETGTHFDPDVVSAFFAAKDSIEQIMFETTDD